MKVFVTLFSLLVLATITVYSCGGGADKTKNDSTSSNTVALSGSQLYNDNCVVCHGQDGTAGMSGATDLSRSVLTLDNIIGVVTNGRNAMRAYGSQFSKEEIEALAKHVESLRK
jgi:mono/diheme cytochrome c family protein